MCKFLTPITFLFLVTVVTAQAAGPTVVLNPNKTSAAVGDTITVNILYQDFPVTEGGGLSLRFNPAVVQVRSVSINTSAWEFANRNGRIDNTSGIVSDILFSSFKGVSGNGTIATVVMEAIGAGNANLRLESSSLTPFASKGQAFTPAFNNGPPVTVTGGTSVEDPPAEDPPADDQPADDPPADDPPADDPPPAEDPPASDPPANDPTANDPAAATTIETTSSTGSTTQSRSGTTRFPAVRAFGTTNQSGSPTVTTADGRQYNQQQNRYSDNYTASGNQAYNNPQTPGSNTIAQQNTASGDKQTQLAQNNPFTQGIANPGNRQSPTASSSMGSDNRETQRRVMPEETSLPWLWLTPLLLLAGYFAVRSFR